MFCLSTVVRGNIRSVVEDENLRAAVIKVSATRVFRQKYALFTGNSRLTSRGEIRTLLQCGVKPGPGSFLFTGRVHFGEAWLGCAPRYKDFQRAYTIAKAAQQIPCELPVDWVKKKNPRPACLPLRVKAALKARPNSALFHVSEETTCATVGRRSHGATNGYCLPKGLRSEMDFSQLHFSAICSHQVRKNQVKLWHKGRGWNEDYKHLALDSFTHSDAFKQVQRKSIEKLSIRDKLSQAINSGLLRVIA